jgi:hypothetical protein
MNKVKAFVEHSENNRFSVYVDLKDNTLNYGIFGEGNTAKEAIEDFFSFFIDMK